MAEMKWKLSPPSRPKLRVRKYPNPLAGTHEEHLAQQEEYLKSSEWNEEDGGWLAEHFAWMNRWNVPAQLEELRKEYESGTKDSVLMALNLCLQYDIEIPDWAANGFLAAIDAIQNFEVNSWDSMFGKPHGGGVHLAAKRKKHLKQYPVFSDIYDLHEAGRPIDESLFEEVGRKHGVGKTLAAEFYYELKKLSDGF